MYWIYKIARCEQRKLYSVFVWTGDRIPVWYRFSVPVKTGPGAHPASYTMGTVSFPGVKRPGRGDDPLLNLASRLKKE